MAKQTVEALMQDIRFVSEANYQIVEAVRALARKCFKDASEEVKYGGILFTAGIQFAGVFAYRAHVSVEFRCGAGIVDAFDHLEGAGKGRRHVKLRSVADLKSKHLAQYLSLAQKAAEGA